MRRSLTWTLCILLAFSVVLAGCGKKDAAGVVKELDKTVTKLTSYKGTGTMTLYTSDNPQEYKVEVWYQNPSYYRISLTNAKKDVTQIVLRNDQGVYVLTPSLNKSFRFQSDWPENQGQVYLYQTLARSILSDNSRQFVNDKDSYVFEVAANYNTSALVRQKIWLSKDNYAPKQVQVSDSSAKVVVEVKFDSFTFNDEFGKDAFDMQRNLDAGKEQSKGTLLEVDENGMLVEKKQEETPASGNIDDEPAAPALSESFGVLIPTYMPEGVEYVDDKVVDGSDRSTALLKYGGTYQYTITESRSPDRTASLAQGTAIDLGFTVGFLSGDQLRTLTWTADGLEFAIISEDLPTHEMVNIAVSMQDQSGK